MSSVKQSGDSHIPKPDGIISPGASASEGPADMSKTDQPLHGDMHSEQREELRSGWNSSCSTTIKDFDLGSPDVVGPKQPRLFPPPEEMDEIDLADASEIASAPPQLPLKTSKNNGSQVHRQRRDMIENIQKLQEGCDVVLGTRLKAHEQRGLMRRDRQMLSDIDARFMQEVRNYLFTSQDERLRRLLDLCEEMQTLRDEILPREDDYNILEDQLNSEEFELAETGGKLLSLLNGVGNGLLDYSDAGSVLEEDVTDLERARSERGSTQRPEVREYLSRLGDRDIVQERLMELRHERAMLVEEEKSRVHVGMVLSEEAQKFLELFDVRHAELQHELADVEDDLERLRKTLDQTDKVLFATTRFDDVENASVSALDEVRHSELDTLPNATCHSDFALLSEVPYSPTPEAKTPNGCQRDPLLLADDATEPTFNRFVGAERKSLGSIHYINAWLLNQQGTMSADKFINDWLLNVLRTSLSEINQFKSAPALQRLKVTQEELRDLVLEWWFNDEAAGYYLRTLSLEARGVSLSVSAAMSNRDAQSDTVVFTLNQLSGRLYRERTTVQVSDAIRLTIRRARSN
jgi:hypothetical protein